jgi:ParB family chromosome partitioning protein
MASQAKNDGPEIVGEIMQLSVADVDPAMDGRIGLFWPEKAAGLAARMLAEGQNDPIKVKRNGNRAKYPWTLIAGAHRLEACRINGSFVDAIEVHGNADDLAAIQASENIDRRELAPLERAMFVAAVADAAKTRLKALHGGKSQQQIAAEIGAAERAVKMTERSDDRADKVQFTPIEKADTEAEAAGEVLSSTYRWSDTTAAACGMGVESLKRSLRIFRIIVEPNRDLMDAFKDCAAAANASALLAICAQGGNPANVRKAIEWLIAHPEAKTADEALVALDMMPSRGSAAAAPATGDTKFLNGLQSNLQRLSLGGQRRAADVIAQAIAPSALVAVRDALNARIAAMETDQSSKGDTK